MDRLKLVMQECTSNEKRKPHIIVDEALPVSERPIHILDGRRDEDGRLRLVVRRPDPVRLVTKLSRLTVTPANVLHQDGMNFTYEAKTYR